ncbi:MAG: 1-deoxy-D-xylulose-5-phosphate reductoisomerase [Acidobacteriota bacterium]
MKNISIIGSTGYIGRKTLEVIRENRNRFRVVALSCGNNVALVLEQIREFNPLLVSVSTEAGAEKVRKAIKDMARAAGGKIGTEKDKDTIVRDEIEIVSREEGMVQVATHSEADFVISAAVGAIGLIPTLRALESGKAVAIANKEALVVGGELIMREAKKQNVQVLPIDSEHSALHQCLRGERIEDVKRLILTASGGPFRNLGKEELEKVTPEEALKHPTWDMGRKITIDSATMMNKGLEIIEARWLFGILQERIDVFLHPQSIVHSMVEFNDGSLKCQMGITDMRGPIQYALTYPERIEADLMSLDLTAMGPLEFFHPDPERFPCLRLAYDAIAVGGTMPAILNASDEIAVQHFLDGEISFTKIPEIIERVMKHAQVVHDITLEAVLEADRQARSETLRFIRELN